MNDRTTGPPVTPAGRRLGDFTATASMLRLVGLAAVAGLLATAIALGLIDLIGVVTNLAYRHSWGSGLSVPDEPLGAATILIPVAGGLVIGAMARYGSERIRGHGIPEAMETILVGGSRAQPRLAVLKPVSSAVSIGTGGPFGAEGPIILTGGAVGSLIGQLVHISAAERKALLVAGAAAGMTAVFGTPVAAVLLGVELLLFEWKPRSMVPVAVAAAVAGALRARLAAAGLLAAAPLFPTPAHPPLDEVGLLEAAAVGVAGGALAWLLTGAVYGAEDLFTRLPVHWGWWPALGGVVVGVGGLVDSRALGVGYATIDAELAGRLAAGSLALLLCVKLVIWATALGSGTSGGILAPLLMMGAALGGLLTPLLHGGSPPLWALLGMAAAMAGVMRSPLTSVVFAFELTRDADALLPLLAACTAAHLVSVLALKRSILTEKVARRGFHVMREYAVDPLEAVLVREVMATKVLTVEAERSVADLSAVLGEGSEHRRQRLYPIVGGDGSVAGVVAWSDIVAARARGDDDRRLGDIAHPRPVVAHAGETLRHVADRMAGTRIGVMPVLDGDAGRLCGVISQFDLLRARERLLQEERHRERTLRLRPLPRGRRAARASVPASQTGRR